MQLKDIGDKLRQIDDEIKMALARRLALLGVGDDSGAMAATLLGTVGEIQRCQEILAAGDTRFWDQNPIHRLGTLPKRTTVACPGVLGAYTHMAACKLFPEGDIRFSEQFGEVAAAVAAGGAEFGVLPVENSSAGQVNQALELAAKHRFYICAETSVKVEHCLCVHPGADPEAIRVVISHPQALAQCAGYLRERGLATESWSNTATAALEVGAAPTDRACICSLGSAELYGLRILDRSVQDYDENYTRFVCFSRRNCLLPGADTVALALAFPNQAGALGRLLTRFAACGLDLCRIQSLPIASRDFHVRFHLDFRGSVEDRRVAALLGDLAGELREFAYLGNYRTVS